MFAEEDSNLMTTGSSSGKGGKEIGLHVEAQRSVHRPRVLDHPCSECPQVQPNRQTHLREAEAMRPLQTIAWAPESCHGAEP